MATRYAVATGNWSALATWDGGASLPGSSDDVYADGKTVTIDQNVTVNTVRTTNRGGGSAGGGFILNAEYTLTCNESGPTGGIVPGAMGAVVTFSASSGTSNIISKLVAGTTANYRLIDVTGTGTVNITSSATISGGGSSSALTINITAAASVNITAPLAGSLNAAAVTCTTSANLAVVGSIVGGSFPAVNNSGAATITITGTCTASSGSPALVNSNASATIKVSGPLVNNGARMAIQSPVLQIGSASTYWQMVDYSNAARNLYTADQIGGNPAAADVRNGTTYGPVGELTGTCHVPGAASVLAGVPIDATVGTVTLTAAGLRAALGMASANLDTQLAALPTEAEIAAAVWAYVTRTITSGGITAQQVWEYATRTLTESTGGGATAKEIWEYVSTLLPDGAEAMLAGLAARLAEQVPTGPVVVLPAPAAGQTIAWVMCYGPSGAIESGVTISIFLSKTTEDGAFDAAAAVLTSDEDGLAQGPIPRGAGHTFKARRGKDGKLYTFAGVDADTLALPSLLGSP